MLSGPVEVEKVYVRYREGSPESLLGDYARRGFWTLGVEVASFESIAEIDEIDDLGPTVGVSGHIGDIARALARIGTVIPETIDYPEPLRALLGRDIRRGTLGEVFSSGKQIFVKPVEVKRFTGFVWQMDAASRRRILCEPDNTPVWISEVLDMRAEFRVFVLDHEILDARRYNGDWALAPDRAVVETAIEAMRPVAPRAYVLDFAVTGDGKTVLIERNEAFAVGHYGLDPVVYARLLSARWFEMAQGGRHLPTV